MLNLPQNCSRTVQREAYTSSSDYVDLVGAAARQDERNGNRYNCWTRRIHDAESIADGNHILYDCQRLW